MRILDAFNRWLATRSGRPYMPCGHVGVRLDAADFVKTWEPFLPTNRALPHPIVEACVKCSEAYIFPIVQLTPREFAERAQ